MSIYTVKVPGATVEVRASSPEEAQKLALSAKPSPVQEAAKKRVNPYGKLSAPVNAIGQGGSFGFADEVDAREAQLQTMAGNALGRLVGKKPQYTGREMYDATMGEYKKQREGFSKDRPVANAGLNIAGSLLMPLGAAGNFVKGTEGAKGLLASTSLMAKSLRSAGLGGLLGGIAGAGSADDGKRLEGAQRGAVAGAAIGGAIPGVGELASKTGTGLVRAANKAAGGKLVDSSKLAGQRLAMALKEDGLTPQQIRDTMNEWLKNGVTPQLMNLGGENTKRLLRAAAGKTGGNAANLAVKNEDRLAASLQGAASERTRALAPSRAPAVRVKDDILKLRDELADKQYKPAYEQPAAITDNVMDALYDDPGKAALRRARTAAVARRDEKQVQDIDALLAAEKPPADPFGWYTPAPENVSAGALDRVRIAMSGRGAKMNQSPDTRDIASGLFDRASDIDQALDNVPGLLPARQSYRGLSAQGEAVDLGMGNPFAHPSDFEYELEKLLGKATPDNIPVPVSADQIRGGARQGVVQNILDSINAPAEGSMGYLNKLSTPGNNYGQVLSEVAPNEAQGYQEAIGNLVQQLKDARFINPNTNSQSVARLHDAGLVDVPALPTGKLAIAKRALDALRRGLTLTDEEREAILRIGMADAPDVLGSLPQLRQPVSQQAIRAVPGMVPSAIQIPVSQ